MKNLNYLIIFMLCMCLKGYAQSQTQNKVGGVCFRVDDHQSASKWRDWNALFNSKGLKFSLAINASRLFNDTAAVNALKEIAASGHELMDHTPDHHMGYFSVKSIADTTAYSGNIAVDHITGTRVCLKVDEPNTNSFIGEGTVNLIGNRLISTTNGAFATINGNPYYALVYLPSRNQYAVYTSVQNKNNSNPDTLVLQTYWGETWKNDTAYNINYHRITTADVKTNAASNLLLAQRSIQLFTNFGLPTPKTWIQPGGSFGLLNRFEVQAFSNVVGYKTGAVNLLSAQKCYNEVDSFSNRRFSLQGPDFYEESNNYIGLINIISDRSARHYNSFGLSHMTNVVGGWNVFLGRVDSLLNWCVVNNIPIRTYEQWGNILSDSVPNQAINIIPSLTKDLNNNNFPDGYNNSSTFNQTDGIAASGFKCFASASNNATLTSISNLGGLEKGENQINIFTKGMLGDSIRMIVSYPEIASPSQIIMFGANTTEWTKQSAIINIPANITRLNVSWIVIKRTNPGMVKMCGMEMNKSSKPVLNKGYYQKKKSTENFNQIDLNSLTSDGVYAISNLNFTIGTAANINFTFNNQNKTISVRTNRRFFVGKDSVMVWVSNPEGTKDSTWFRFESEAYSINYGDTLKCLVDLNPLPTQANWTSKPIDSMLYVNLPHLTARPKVSTWYLLDGIQNGNVLVDSFLVTVIGSAQIDTIKTDTGNGVPVVLPLTPSEAFAQKVGGVCFRIDDHQTAVNWRALNAVFNKYNQKFTVGVNANRLLGDTAALNALKEIAAAGHELADHTPDHTLTFFNVVSVKDTAMYFGNAGVDHFNGKKVCLKVDSVITNNYSLEGLVNISSNMVISQANGEWKDMGSPIYYSNIYLPVTNKTYSYTSILNKNQNDPDTLYLVSYWGESVFLGNLNSVAYHRLTQYDIKPGTAALNLMMNRTRFVFDSLGLPRPKTFLQPSGNYAMMNRNEVKSYFAEPFGYTAGAVFQSPSFKCYNEIDIEADKRFGMNGPDFKEETASAASIMALIADNSAKHHVSFGLSSMYGMTGGLTGYIARLDSLLNWCKNKNLPILTMNQWANVLYDSVPNKMVNCIPSLQNDLNTNGVPDGFSGPFSVFDTLDGVTISNNRSYSRSTNGIMTNIQNLGGFEKGYNNLIVYTKGMPGDSVRITISYPDLGGSTTNIMIGASNANWTENIVSIALPFNSSRMNVSFYATKRGVAGNIKISGMQLIPNGLFKTTETSPLEPNETTGLRNIKPNELLIYPNPFINEISVIGKNIETANLYDLKGNKVEVVQNRDNGNLLLQIGEIATGIYFLQIESANGEMKSMKLIKN